MNVGVALGRLNPAFFLAVTEAAEELGFESVWLPEHLVLPISMSGSPNQGEAHPPIPSGTPVFDACAYLAFLAGRTEKVLLGTHVYNLALRHPFVSARAFQTLDVVSGGRAIAGVGAGWLEQEWAAVGLDFATRGPRLDEAISVCRALWRDDVIEHHGRFFDFPPVAFEPKPTHDGGPPILIGGESPAALRRAARLGDGWIGMGHTPTSAARVVERLLELRQNHGRSNLAFSVTVGGEIGSFDDLEVWRTAGVDRVIVAPWSRSVEAVAGLREVAQQLLR